MFLFSLGLLFIPSLAVDTRASVQLPTILSPIISLPPPPLGVSAPFLADFCQNISFSPRLCCLFYRSLSLCCEGLRLLVMEVNLTNLRISPFLYFGLISFPFSYMYVSVFFLLFVRPFSSFLL